MRIVQRISEKIGLTQTELKVNVFLLLVLIGGLIIKLIGWESTPSDQLRFDYTSIDSIFYTSDSYKPEINTNKIFDSNLESLDFNKSNFKINPTKQELKEKSINLNSAGLEQLALLPGIGIKTAEKILAYRKASGGFSNIDELLEVKGIGNSKLDKIKKYIFIR